MAIMSASIDHAILGVAGTAAGVCTRAELRAAGMSNRTVTSRVASGSLQPVGRGVFLVPALETDETRYFIASRAHPRGAISHLSAGHLWGFALPGPSRSDPVEVTVPAAASGRPAVDGVLIYRTRRWCEDDLAPARPNLTATSPARTIVDLAGSRLTDRRLRHLVQNQVTAGRLDLAAIWAALSRNGGPGVEGAGRLQRLLVELDDGEPLPQSELERRAQPLLGSGFRRQFRPPWFDGIRGVADFAHPESGVIVEVDGRRWHTIDQSRVEDRRRDRLASVNGWVVLRYTWRDVTEQPSAVQAEIETLVTARRKLAS